VFHKKCGLQQADMTPSAWIYGQLKLLSGGLEAGTSYLKRCFGLDRCNWRGWEHFQA
jgi:IS5 family transposase